jgi:hypothetical protein
VSRPPARPWVVSVRRPRARASRITSDRVDRPIISGEDGLGVRCRHLSVEALVPPHPLRRQVRGEGPAHQAACWVDERLGGAMPLEQPFRPERIQQRLLAALLLPDPSGDLGLCLPAVLADLDDEAPQLPDGDAASRDLRTITERLCCVLPLSSTRGSEPEAAVCLSRPCGPGPGAWPPRDDLSRIAAFVVAPYPQPTRLEAGGGDA